MEMPQRTRLKTRINTQKFIWSHGRNNINIKRKLCNSDSTEHRLKFDDEIGYKENMLEM